MSDVEKKALNSPIFLTKNSAEKKTLTLLRLHTGNFFGAENGHLNPKKRYTVRAVSDVLQLVLLPFDVPPNSPSNLLENPSKFEARYHKKNENDYIRQDEASLRPKRVLNQNGGRVC